MDRLKIPEHLKQTLKKYRYAGLIVLVGVFLMCIPTGKETQAQATPSIQQETAPTDLSASLASILCKIEGAGKVEVLLTEARGKETLYQSDDDTAVGSDSSSTRRDTVLITDTDRNQLGLIRQINPPVYQGAVVVCQGADRASVRLAIVAAVSSVTGLGASQITVLKMK